MAAGWGRAPPGLNLIVYLVSCISSGHALSRHPANDASSTWNALRARIGLRFASAAQDGVWCAGMLLDKTADPLQSGFSGLLPCPLG